MLQGQGVCYLYFIIRHDKSQTLPNYSLSRDFRNEPIELILANKEYNVKNQKLKSPVCVSRCHLRNIYLGFLVLSVNAKCLCNHLHY